MSVIATVRRVLRPAPGPVREERCGRFVNLRVPTPAAVPSSGAYWHWDPARPDVVYAGHARRTWGRVRVDREDPQAGEPAFRVELGE